MANLEGLKFGTVREYWTIDYCGRWFAKVWNILVKNAAVATSRTWKKFRRKNFAVALLKKKKVRYTCSIIGCWKCWKICVEKSEDYGIWFVWSPLHWQEKWISAKKDEGKIEIREAGKKGPNLDSCKCLQTVLVNVLVLWTRSCKNRSKFESRWCSLFFVLDRHYFEISWSS